jgi:preprotein translocase subunit SecF
MHVNIISKRKVWFIFSSISVGISLLFLTIWGLKPGIDFTGGSLMRLEFSKEKITDEQIKQALLSPKNENDSEGLNEAEASLVNLEKYGNITTQTVGEKELIIKLKALNEREHQEIFRRIKEKTAEIQNGSAEEELVREIKFDSIGPSIGEELKKKSQGAIIVVLLAIIGFIAWAFKTVSSQINKYESIRYGVIAIVALVHDIIIVLGVFSFLGHFWGVELDTFFIAALLTILGYSVNDTIVIFDRIRENILKLGSENFGGVVNKSINETLLRSINTSTTTLLVLFCVLFFGGQSTFYFILALIIGVISGTYSSIFLASPLLVWWKQKKY